MAESEPELLDKFNEAEKELGMKMNVKKTKTMVK